jgi:hypothetical protein
MRSLSRNAQAVALGQGSAFVNRRGKRWPPEKVPHLVSPVLHTGCPSTLPAFPLNFMRGYRQPLPVWVRGTKPGRASGHLVSQETARREYQESFFLAISREQPRSPPAASRASPPSSWITSAAAWASRLLGLGLLQRREREQLDFARRLAAKGLTSVPGTVSRGRKGSTPVADGNLSTRVQRLVPGGVCRTATRTPHRFGSAADHERSARPLILAAVCVPT